MVDVVVIYLVITIVFSVLLLIMAISGGIGGIVDFGGADVGGPDIGADLGGVGHDIGHDAGQFTGTGIHPLSLPIMFAFGAFFGAFGTVFESMQLLPIFVVPLLAAIIASVLTAMMYFLLQVVFSKSQVTTEYKLADLIGGRGEITVPVHPGVRGQVLVSTDARGRTLLSAMSSQDLKTGDRVQITGVEGGALIVEKV
ncbi:MAG TPA: NfeD family protein [Thermoplasmata archaeon]|nr:NfeD family protein [Thermoplasmata archaeon]